MPRKPREKHDDCDIRGRASATTFPPTEDMSNCGEGRVRDAATSENIQSSCTAEDQGHDHTTRRVYSVLMLMCVVY